MRVCGQKGFTLIELLIALTLIAMITTLMFGGIRVGNRVWDSTDRRSQSSTEIRLIWRFLNDRLIQTKPVMRQTPEGQRLLFTGTSSALEFITPLPAHLGIGGYYLVRLQTVTSGKKKGLLFLRWLYHTEVLEGVDQVPEWQPLELRAVADDPGEGPGEARAYYSRNLLVDEVESLEFSYFGAGEGEQEPEWKSEWQERALMPQLVRIRLEDKTGQWPEMIFPLPDSGRRNVSNRPGLDNESDDQ